MIRIDDRVKVVLANEPIKTTRGKILNGATGTVKDIHRFFSTGIEFDDDIGGNSGNWGGKDGHCWYVDNECLEEIEESEVKEMSDLKIGDRVKVVSEPTPSKTIDVGVMVGMTGTVKELGETYVGVEFDEDIGGHCGDWNGKSGYCWYIIYKHLEKIEESEVKEMSEFKIGDRVEAIGGSYNSDINIGDRGTIVSVDGSLMGVDFDIDIGGHDCSGRGRYGHCWRVPTEYLKKIEETNEEIKAETMEQKILEVLREEIGVDIGEEFDVYKNGKNQWTCKFEKNEFTRKVNDEFQETGLWKSIVGDFGGYRFKKKPFVPKYGEDYFFLAPEYDKSKGLNFRALQSTWIDSSIDDGMLAVGNIFRTKEEALKRRDKLLEKPNELSKGE